MIIVGKSVLVEMIDFINRIIDVIEENDSQR